MAPPPLPNDPVAHRRAQSFERMRTWAKQHAQACSTIETGDEEVLDIRLGDRRQIFLVAPRRKALVHFLVFGTLPRAPRRHGCPGKFLNWLQETAGSAFPQAMFVPHLNSYAVSCTSSLDDWSKTERQLHPIIEFLVDRINRLLVCDQEANLLTELDSADAHALRTRFQEDTLACLAFCERTCVMGTLQ